MLVKLTPGLNFINILRTIFLYESCFGSFFYVHVTRGKLPKRRSYKKSVRKTLMKLTAGHSFLKLLPAEVAGEALLVPDARLVGGDLFQIEDFSSTLLTS